MTRISNRVTALLAATLAMGTGVGAAVAVGASAPASVPATAAAAHAPESIFQDDDHLIYATSATVSHVLGVLEGLGVDRLRLTIEWADIAPDATSTTEPAGFDATNPAEYPTDIWDHYDRIVEMAQARGIAVDFNLTAPGPLWAMQPAPTTTQYGTRPADHYDPSATDFGQFVQAVGTRYSGTYVPPVISTTTTTTPAIPLLPGLGGTTTTVTTTTPGTGPPLPRVDYWSIWNEPDQPGWLAPQWRRVGNQSVPDSPRLYRGLLDAAVTGLAATGHTTPTDTILIGETAPEGSVRPVPGSHPQRFANNTGFYDAMTPMVFVRALYCVGAHYKPLMGTSASALGCPTSGSAQSFVDDNPGLFHATGFAHHPYFFLFSPSYSSPVADFVPLSDLGRLERGLDRIFATYGVLRHIPIYITEYGYQTNPPDPYQVVTPAEQAAYLNEADYMAWRDPRVRSVAQFLLYDAGPDPAYQPSSLDYWDTFQTGLAYGPGTPRDGERKPAFDAYRLPIWIPTRTVTRRSKMLIWGMLRLAPMETAQHALIQWRPARHGSYRTIATVAVPASAVYGYFTTRIVPPGTGSIRIAWSSATGQTFTSRVVTITVRSRAAATKPSPTQGATPLTGATPTG